MPDLIITPNRSFTTTGIPRIDFIGVSGSGISLQVLENGSLAFIGNAGSLFGINDSLTGSLMSVTDIAGLPILEVFDTDKVVMGSFGTNALVVSGSGVAFGTDKINPNRQLYISGSFEYLSEYVKPNTVNSNYSIQQYDNRIYCNNTDLINLTFSSAASNNGRLLNIKLINTGIVRLTGVAGELFDGSPSYILSSQYETRQVHSNGSNWYIW